MPVERDMKPVSLGHVLHGGVGDCVEERVKYTAPSASFNLVLSPRHHPRLPPAGEEGGGGFLLRAGKVKVEAIYGCICG